MAADAAGGEAPGTGAAAVIVAAGRGTRCGQGVRKQFRRIGGRPVLEWTCRAFRASGQVEALVVVLPPDVAGRPPEWLAGLPDRVVAGGSSRRASVGRGVEAAPREAGIILVHDGVRPFVSGELIGRVRRAASAGAVTPAIGLADAVKEVDGEGRVLRTMDRARLRRVQTPQGFPAPLLRRLHRDAEREDRSAPDDAILCERAGHEVRIVPGDPRNIKLTTPRDFLYAEWLLEADGDGGRP